MEEGGRTRQGGSPFSVRILKKTFLSTVSRIRIRIERGEAPSKGAEPVPGTAATGRSHEASAGEMKSFKNVPGLFSVEEQVREEDGAGFVRIGREVRHPLGGKYFLVDEEVPRAGMAVAREDRAGCIGHDLGLAAV